MRGSTLLTAAMHARELTPMKWCTQAIVFAKPENVGVKVCACADALLAMAVVDCMT